MGKAGLEKLKEKDANKIITFCIYSLKVKVDAAKEGGIHYVEVKGVEKASWKLINCLVDPELVNEIAHSAEHRKISARGRTPELDRDGQNKLNDNNENADFACSKETKKKKMAIRESNNRLCYYIAELNDKVEDAKIKDIHFIKISGLEDLFWKIIDCLVEDEVVDSSIKLAKNMKWAKTIQRSPGVYHPRVDRPKTPVSSTKQRRSKSAPRYHPTEKYDSPEICQKRLVFDDNEDGYKTDHLNPITCTCAQSETYYKCRISLLEKQQIKLENDVHRSEENNGILKKNKEHYESLAHDYILKFRELKNTIDSRKTSECPLCEVKLQRMMRYRAEREDLREDKKKMEKDFYELEEEKNDLAQQLFKLASEYDKLVEENESLKTQIFNAEPDETLCLKIKSFENTIDSQKKLILEIQKRETDLINALKGAEQATEDTKNLLKKCRGEKNVVKTKLSGHELENDKLQCEKDQLQKCLKKQKQLAEENIKKLNKKLREKEKDLQQSNQIIDELTIKLEEIEEFPGRERNELLQQQENNKILGRENESLQAKIYELENKLAEEKREEIDIEHKYKIKISNLKIENTRAGEKLREAGRDYETLNSRYKDQQAILSSERCRFEEELKELRLRLDEKSPKSVISVDNRWSRSATCHKEIIYKTGDEGFMDMFKRSPSSLQERDTTAGSRSDTEKENLSLKSELTVALENIEKYKQEYKDLAERYEREMKAVKKTIDSLHREKNSLEQEKNDWKAKLDQSKSDLNRYKHKQVNQQDSSHEKIDNLLQQNRKLENDRELLRDRIFSLKNEKIKLEELEKRLDKSTEENQLLQSEKDKLQHKLGELSTQLKKSDARSIKLETDLTLLQKLRTENEDLKASLGEAKKELGTLEKRYNKERGERLSSENTSTKLKDENDRLRRDINSARIELHRVLREKEESNQNLNTEQVLGREELQNKEREKSELVALFKDKEDKDLQKIKLYEKEIESLKSRCSEDNDKMRQSEHEIEALKSRWKDDNEKIQQFEYEIETLKSRCGTDNDKMRQMEREIETLKSRLTGEKANQYSSYEMLQNKNDLEACKHQKKALEDERNELQKENMELENELQSLNSKLEQIGDSEKNISNLKKHIKDLEEGYRNVVTNVHEAERQIQELKETVEDQKQENRDLIVNLENLDKEKKDLENKLRVMFSKDETSKLQKDNAELKHNLQNLSKQLKESENRLVLKETEQSSIIEECEELKRILQDKQRELSRLHELKDAKESSDVLRKQVQELQFEYSELNRRLEESNKENSSLRKENKKMENSLKEKLAEEKKMNARFQQYAEKFEEIPALKRHMDKVQSENTELNLKCRHLQTLEKEVQKLKKENQQLNTENISQRQNIETLNNRLEILNGEKLEIEDRLRRRSPQVVSESKTCQNCFKYRNDISDLKREINDLRDRLSEAAGNKLRDNNPNIADLSDMNRPTSLAEKFSSLYTDEYTDAMEVIEDDMDEAASVKVMLDWLKKCYDWCQRLAKEQRDTLINRSIGFMENHGGQNVVLSDRCLIFVKEFQKKIAVESLAVVGQICHVKSVTQKTLSSEKYIVKYIKKCSELCWMMQISDPPLYVNFDVNSGENLNKNDYNVFTKSGSKIDYLVWPVLYLHKTGPMLAKGVAQGK